MSHFPPQTIELRTKGWQHYIFFALEQGVVIKGRLLRTPFIIMFLPFRHPRVIFMALTPLAALPSFSPKAKDHAALLHTSYCASSTISNNPSVAVLLPQASNGIWAVPNTK